MRMHSILISLFFSTASIAASIGDCFAQDAMNRKATKFHPSVMQQCDNMLDGRDEVSRENAVAYYKCIVDIKDQYYPNYDPNRRAVDLKLVDLASDYAHGKITITQFKTKADAAERTLSALRLQKLREEQQKQAPTLLGRCDKLTPNFDINRKNAVSYYRCVLDTKQKYGDATPDELALAKKRLELAKEYAAGTLSEKDYEAFNNELGNAFTMNRLNKEQQQYEAQRQSEIDANNAQSDYQRRLLREQQILQMQQQTYANEQRLRDVGRQNMQIFNRPTVNTNCYGYGNSINCTSTQPPSIPFPQ